MTEILPEYFTINNSARRILPEDNTLQGLINSIINYLWIAQCA